MIGQPTSPIDRSIDRHFCQLDPVIDIANIANATVRATTWQLAAISVIRTF
jgi:hypothetical protein